MPVFIFLTFCESPVLTHLACSYYGTLVHGSCYDLLMNSLSRFFSSQFEPFEEKNLFARGIDADVSAPVKRCLQRSGHFIYVLTFIMANVTCNESENFKAWEPCKSRAVESTCNSEWFLWKETFAICSGPRAN